MKKLLQATEEELYKDTVSCERPRELLSTRRKILKLMLPSKTEEGILMDELEADTVKTVDYYLFYLWKASVMRMIDREQATVREQGSLGLSVLDWDTASVTTQSQGTVQSCISP